jgi:hypothetical protein
MVNQKSDGFRSLTGFHGGLRRGTAAAAFGAVLVLSAGVPASNAAASDLPEDADGGTTAAAGLGATVDAAGLEAWAAAALSNERKLSSDHRDGGHRSGEPRPSDQPAPSVPPSLAPVVPSPTPDPSVTISARPAPAVPVPFAFRHGPLRAVAFRPGPLRSGSDVAGPVRAGPRPFRSPPLRRRHLPPRRQARQEVRRLPRPGQRIRPRRQPRPPRERRRRLERQQEPGAGRDPQTAPAARLAGQTPGPATGTAGSPLPTAGSSQTAATTETPSATPTRSREITGLSGGAGLRDARPRASQAVSGARHSSRDPTTWQRSARPT